MRKRPSAAVQSLNDEAKQAKQKLRRSLNGPAIVIETPLVSAAISTHRPDPHRGVAPIARAVSSSAACASDGAYASYATWHASARRGGQHGKLRV